MQCRFKGHVCLGCHLGSVYLPHQQQCNIEFDPNTNHLQTLL